MGLGVRKLCHWGCSLEGDNHFLSLYFLAAEKAFLSPQAPTTMGCFIYTGPRATGRAKQPQAEVSETMS